MVAVVEVLAYMVLPAAGLREKQGNIRKISTFKSLIILLDYCTEQQAEVYQNKPIKQKVLKSIKMH